MTVPVSAWPRPRRQRTPPGPAAAAAVETGAVAPAGPSIPRVRHWFFRLQQGNAFRAVAVSGPFTAPALVERVTLLSGNMQATNPPASCGIGIIAAPLQEGTGLSATPLSGVEWIITETDFRDSGQPFATMAEPGFTFALTQTLGVALETRYPVVRGPFYLLATLRVQTAVGMEINGIARVVEGLSLEELANLV